MFAILSLLAPVFVLLFIGILVERFRLVPPGGAATLNMLVFNLAMPCLIFSSMAIRPIWLGAAMWAVPWRACSSAAHWPTALSAGAFAPATPRRPLWGCWPPFRTPPLWACRS